MSVIKHKYHRLFLLAFILVLCSTISFVFNKLTVASPLLISGFIITCIAMRGYPNVSGLIFTMWMFTAIAIALSYPHTFQSYGDFRLSRLIPPLLQIIMFGMGSQMSLRDFSGVLKMPQGVFVGLLCHYSMMPCIGYSIAKLFGFPPEIVVGIILLACTPSGMASNVIVFLGKGNLALAITVTAFSTMLSPFLTPFLLKFIAGQLVHVDVIEMMMEIVKMVLFPIIAGLSFNNFCFDGAKRKSIYWQLCVFFIIIILKNLIVSIILHTLFKVAIISFFGDLLIFFILPSLAGLLLKQYIKGNRIILSRILSLISQVGLVIITIIIIANGYDTLLSKWGLLMVPAMLLHNCFGYLFGYWFCRFIHMKEQDCRALSIEVGMQNGGLASAMAVKLQVMEQTSRQTNHPGINTTDLTKIGTGFAIPAAVFSPIQGITGSVLAMWFRNRPVREESETVQN